MYNYLPPFSKDLLRLLATCFLLFGCVNIHIGWTLLVGHYWLDTIGWTLLVDYESSQDPWGGDIQLFNPFSPLVFYSNFHNISRANLCIHTILTCTLNVIDRPI